jgi:hypothetical protein
MDTTPSDSEIFFESPKASTPFRSALIQAIPLNAIPIPRRSPVFERQ